jgi:hypothetical protein
LEKTQSVVRSRSPWLSWRNGVAKALERQFAAFLPQAAAQAA